MAETNLNIKVRLQNLVSGELSKIKTGFNGLKNFQQDWVSLTAKIWLFTNAIRTASRFIGGFVSEAIKAEDAFKRLSNAVTLNGEQTERVMQKYTAFAKEMQRTTRYGDDDVMELMQQLVSVGGVAEAEMERATKVAIDFASATGRDLSTAGLTVAKAMAGATGELSRYGIILGDNIPASQKATRALAEMEKKFGGFAQKDVNSYGGTIAQLGESFTDLQQAIGEFVTQDARWAMVLEDLKKSMEGLIELLDQVRGKSNDPKSYMLEDLKNVDEAITRQRKLAERAFFNTKKVNEDLVKLENERLTIIQAINQEHEFEASRVVELENIVVKQTDNTAKDVEKTFKMMDSVAEQTAKNMHNAFSDFFFKGLKGELNNLRDIMTSFGDAMLQMFAQMMAFQSMKMMFGKVGFFADFFKTGYAVGTSYVPQTGLYPLHKGETVKSAGNSRGGEGGGLTINVNQAITAWDASDVYRNRKALADAVAFEIQSNGNIRSAIQKYT